MAPCIPISSCPPAQDSAVRVIVMAVRDPTTVRSRPPHPVKTAGAQGLLAFATAEMQNGASRELAPWGETPCL